MEFARHRPAALQSQLLGYVDAVDGQGAEAAVAEQFKLDEVWRRRLLVRKLG